MDNKSEFSYWLPTHLVSRTFLKDCTKVRPAIYIYRRSNKRLGCVLVPILNFGHIPISWYDTRTPSVAGSCSPFHVT